MNLNTNNPLLLAAINGGGAAIDPLATMGGNASTDIGPAGLFFRRGASNLNLNDDDEEDMMFGGTLGVNGTFIPNARNGFHPYMGPLPSAGTDKDFVWGFILGFFVGFIMLFWVWMPTGKMNESVTSIWMNTRYTAVHRSDNSCFFFCLDIRKYH